MIESIETFLTNTCKALQLEAGSTPYGDKQIHFAELPRDFLKDNDFAVACLCLQDRHKKDGRIISRVRNPECTHYTFARRIYRRDLLYRCFLHAAGFDDLWRSGGMVDQFEQAMATTRLLADANNNAILVDLQEAARPSRARTEKNRQLKRPHTAIIRVGFAGGIYTSWSAAIIPSISFEPTIK